MVKPISNFYIKGREGLGILMKGGGGDACRVEGNIFATKAALTQTIKAKNIFKIIIRFK